MLGMMSIAIAPGKHATSKAFFERIVIVRTFLRLGIKRNYAELRLPDICLPTISSRAKQCQ